MNTKYTKKKHKQLNASNGLRVQLHYYSRIFLIFVFPLEEGDNGTVDRLLPCPVEVLPLFNALLSMRFSLNHTDLSCMVAKSSMRYT